jgi:hypothetical protein
MVLGLNIDPEDEARRQAEIQARAQQTAQAAAGAAPVPTTPGTRIGLGPGLVPASLANDPAARDRLRFAQGSLTPTPEDPSLTQRVLDAPAGPRGSGISAQQITDQDEKAPGFFDKMAQGLKENPLESIGLLLAGIGGNTAAIKSYNATRDRQIAQQQLAIDTWETGFNMTDTVVNQAFGMTDEAGIAHITAALAPMEGISPGITELALGLHASGPDGAQILQATKEFQGVLLPLFTNRGGGVDVPRLRDYYVEHRGELEAQADNNNRPMVTAKFALMMDTINKGTSSVLNRGIESLDLPRDEDGNLMLTMADIEFLNRQLPDESFRLNAGELGTLRRQSDIVERFGVASIARTDARIEAEGEAFGAARGQQRAETGIFKDEEIGGDLFTRNIITGQLTRKAEGTPLDRANADVAEAYKAYSTAYAMNPQNPALGPLLLNYQQAQTYKARIAAGDLPEFVDLQNQRTSLQAEKDALVAEGITGAGAQGRAQKLSRINQQIRELDAELAQDPEAKQAIPDIIDMQAEVRRLKAENVDGKNDAQIAQLDAAIDEEGRATTGTTPEALALQAAVRDLEANNVGGKNDPQIAQLNAILEEKGGGGAVGATAQPDVIDFISRRQELEIALAADPENLNLKRDIAALTAAIRKETELAGGEDISPTGLLQKERAALEAELAELGTGPENAERRGQLERNIAELSGDIADDVGPPIIRLMSERADLETKLAAAMEGGALETDDMVVDLTRRIGEITNKIQAVGATDADLAATAGARLAATTRIGRVNEALDELGTGILRVEQIAQLLSDVNTKEALSGVKGWALRTFGGVAGQLSLELQSIFERFVDPEGNVTSEEAQRFRTEAQALVAKSVPFAAGEETGRITAAELEIANHVLAALNPAAGPSEIRAALEAAMSFDLISNEDNRIKGEQGITPALEGLSKGGKPSEPARTAAVDFIMKEYGLGIESTFRLIVALEAVLPRLLEVQEARP